MEIPLGKWRPDRLPYELDPGDLIQAHNVLPYEFKYMPALGKAPYTATPFSSAALGAAEYKSINGSYYAFIGTATKLYRLNPDKSITDATRSAGGAYATADNWTFAQFGDWVIGTNYVDAMQVMKGMTATNFQALGGSPPKAKYCLLYREMLITAYINDGTVWPKKVRWSKLEDPETWAETGYDGPDEQDLPDAIGEITGLGRIGEHFIVFHEDSLTLATFAGYAPFAFSFYPNRVVGIGCISHGSIVSVNDLCYFFGKDNIYAFNGNQVNPIGTDLKETVIHNINSTYYSRITSTVDPLHGIIYWSYPSTASLDGTPDKLLCYNYRQDKFTLLDLPMNCLIGFHSGGILMDSIDAIYPDVADMPFQLDSTAYKGNVSQVGCVDNATNLVATLNGNALSGTIETGEISQEGIITHVNRVRPKVAGALTGSVSVRIGARMQENADPAYSAAAVVGADGYAYMRASGRYIRALLTLDDNDGVTAIQADAAPAGKR